MSNKVCLELSVLMSVYKSENPKFLKQSLESVFSQSLKASQVILVQDGPLSKELIDTINLFSDRKELYIIKLEKNCGLAVALNKGLAVIKSEYIARMDTDDIALPNRFEKEVEYLKLNKEIDIVGSYISEIDENNEVIKEIVKYPITHEECFDFYAKRNCFAHPTVMFRKSFFEKIGGQYNEDCVGLKRQEDLDLWCRGFLSGCRFANLPEVLLLFRRTSIFYNRRAGFRYSLLMLKEKIKRNKLLGYGPKANLYALAYFGMNLMPNSIKKILYRYAR